MTAHYFTPMKCGPQRRLPAIPHRWNNDHKDDCPTFQTNEMRTKKMIAHYFTPTKCGLQRWLPTIPHRWNSDHKDDCPPFHTDEMRTKMMIAHIPHRWNVGHKDDCPPFHTDGMRITIMTAHYSTPCRLPKICVESYFPLRHVQLSCERLVLLTPSGWKWASSVNKM